MRGKVGGNPAARGHGQDQKLGEVGVAKMLVGFVGAHS